MNLFDMMEQNCQVMPTEVLEGTRLQRLELLNWGTFHQKIWTLNLHGETGLLTGDVGSGKSSVVDAITTLLVPPQRTVYNKAADASAKERTITSYFYGYYAQEEGYEGTSKPLALRTKSSYTVLLAEFQNKWNDTTITLAQLLYYTESESKSTPKRIFVLFEGCLSIAKDFSHFTGDARVIKARLKEKGCFIYDDFSSYSAAFRKRLGNLNEQALNLFAQTISMKTVDKLTPFIRTNMLEADGDIGNTIDLLIGHYKSLNEAYQDVCNAKKKIEMLTPMADAGTTYERHLKAAQQFEQALYYLPYWVAREKQHLLDKQVAEYQKSLDEQSFRYPQAVEKQQQLETELRKLDLEIYEQGGGRLERLKEDVTRLTQTQKTRQAELDSYQQEGARVSIPVPTDHGSFLHNRERIAQQLSDLDRQHQIWMDGLHTTQNEISDQSKTQSDRNQELQSLRGRTSNLGRNFIDLRNAICGDLGLTHDELPFVGELLEVKEEESQWEGSLERLLHSLARSLVVPQSHYPQVADWIETNNLKMRLVYYSVPQRQALPEPRQLHPDCALNKLKIKETTPYYNWILNQLYRSADHICCDTIAEFTRNKKAITRNGQIKNDTRHEKDDRRNIGDRRQYVMGFSNQKKVLLLETELCQLEASLKELRLKQDALTQELRDESALRKALFYLQSKENFEMLDVASIAKRIKEVQADIFEIEHSNDLLHSLEQKREKLTQQKQKQDELVMKIHGNIQVLKKDLQSMQSAQSENQKNAQKEIPDTSSTILSRLGQPDTIATLSQWDEHTKKLQGKLESKRKESEKLHGDASRVIIKYMGLFRTQFSNECAEFDDNIQSLREFLQILEQCQKHDLPRHEDKFKRDLQKNLLRNIGIFHQKINESSNRIQLKINQINQSLRDIQYNRGTYIAVGCQNTRDAEIIEFRYQLRQCTEGSAQGLQDVDIAEAKFHQIKKIIDRLNGREGFTDSDKSWRKKVTDVRNWHDFSASEWNLETGAQIEYYTDSGGKSGGQKEKLAYTILAAGLAYNFNLINPKNRPESFRFVVIDEAFLKSSDESTRFGLELFRTMGFQLLIVTPLLKITTIEPYIANVGLVQQDKNSNESTMQTLTLECYQQMREEKA